jgi:hypothetical protein
LCLVFLGFFVFGFFLGFFFLCVWFFCLEHFEVFDFYKSLLVGIVFFCLFNLRNQNNLNKQMKWFLWQTINGELIWKQTRQKDGPLRKSKRLQPVRTKSKHIPRIKNANPKKNNYHHHPNRIHKSKCIKPLKVKSKHTPLRRNAKLKTTKLKSTSLFSTIQPVLPSSQPVSIDSSAFHLLSTQPLPIAAIEPTEPMIESTFDLALPLLPLNQTSTTRLYKKHPTRHIKPQRCNFKHFSYSGSH